MDISSQPPQPSEPAGAKPPTPDPHLIKAFDSSTSIHAWGEFLTKVQKQLEASGGDGDDDGDATTTTVTVSPKILMYKDQKSKASRIKFSKRDGPLGAIEGTTVVSAIRELKSSGTILVCVNSFANAVQQRRIDSDGGPGMWHTYAIYYGDGLLAIYDPYYVKGATALGGCKGIPLMKHLVQRMRMRNRGFGKRLNSVWIGGGGGGNDSAKCEEMTRAWIYEEVCIKQGRDLGNWKDREGWVQLQY